MGQPPGLRRIADVLAGCSLLAVVACQSPGSQSIVGPDGSQMAHVHCGAEQGVCCVALGHVHVLEPPSLSGPLSLSHHSTIDSLIWWSSSQMTWAITRLGFASRRF